MTQWNTTVGILERRSCQLSSMRMNMTGQVIGTCRKDELGMVRSLICLSTTALVVLLLHYHFLLKTLGDKIFSSL